VLNLTQSKKSGSIGLCCFLLSKSTILFPEHLSQNGDTFLCKGKKILLTDLGSTCMGLLILASAKTIKKNCLDSNTWAVHSISMISTNHVCTCARTLLPIQIIPGCHIRIIGQVFTADNAWNSYITLRVKLLKPPSRSS